MTVLKKCSWAPAKILRHNINLYYTDASMHVHVGTHTWHLPGLRCSSMLIDLRLSEQGTSLEQSSLLRMLCVAGSH
jgi:hypothetical protein